MSLNGLILAGGKSLRMGVDKSTLQIHGKPQVAHLTAILEPFVEQVFISVRDEQKNSTHLNGLEIITDEYKTASPLNGILSAMKTHPELSWLVIAVDMPNITADAIKILIQNRNKKSAATCFEMPEKGGPEPLFAIWENHSFSTLEELVADKTEHICPRTTLKVLGSTIIRNSIDSNVLANLNTPEELKKFVA